jgi:beta-fructofuranosidase
LVAFKTVLLKDIKMKLNTAHIVGMALCATAVIGQGNPPAGSPVEGNYTGRYRPQIHFSPPKFYMNDPNGLFVDDEDTWHLYYQYNPTGINQGNQHWGHATSKDLYHWTNHPVAISPPEDGVLIYSGSAVIDKDNTSGFFPNQTNGVVAIYVSVAESG